MSRYLLGSGMLLLAVALARPQEASVRVYASPAPLSREVLSRLGLQQAWRAKLPTDGRREGIYGVQVLPAEDYVQIAVQTTSGRVYLLDGETGDLLWAAAVGLPYWQGQPVGYNTNSVFVTRRDQLYILNRKTGKHRLTFTDPATGVVHHGFRLLSAPSAAPVADEQSVFFSMENRVAAYTLPVWEGLGPEKYTAAKPTTYNGSESSITPSEPELAWVVLEVRAHFPHPMLTGATVGAIATDGNLYSLAKFERRERYTYKFEGEVPAPPGQYRTIAYVPCMDFNLYAFEMLEGRVTWRFMSGFPILRKPAVLDRDVYVSPQFSGMYRLDRETGQPVWRNRDGVRFLSTNGRFVYSADRLGRLLVLDHARGTELARYDVRDWPIQVDNEWTDRLYFAANDGQVICLHHRDFPQPVRLRKFEILRPKKEIDELKEVQTLPADKKEEKKEEEKKDARRPALPEDVSHALRQRPEPSNRQTGNEAPAAITVLPRPIRHRASGDSVLASSLKSCWPGASF